MVNTRKLVSSLFFLFATAILLGFSSCEDRAVSTNPSARLVLSTDTISFDTLFTDTGSATRTFRIYNPTKNILKIDAIELVGATNFIININGVMTNELSDIQLRAKDSMTVFVQVFIDPTDNTLPFLVKDSILIQSNTNTQKVVLQAFGQDAYRIYKREIGTDTTWNAEKPYLILDSISVAEDATLTLAPGVQLYFAKKGGLYVKGTLKANGTQANPVVFTGNRLDNMFDNLPYDKVPNQWQGIRFYTQSKANELTYAIVENTNWGIQLDSTSLDTNTLQISNSIIRNAATNLIRSTHSVLQIQNSVLYNAGYSCLVLRGGRSEVVHSTIANYFSFPWAIRKAASIVLSNYAEKEMQAIPLPLKQADFTNSIVYGSWSQEIAVQTSFLGVAVDEETNYTFNHCLLKMQTTDVDEAHFTKVLVNQSPLFRATKVYEYDFTLQDLSPAIGIADVAVSQMYPLDINGNQRVTDGKADVGAYVYRAE